MVSCPPILASSGNIEASNAAQSHIQPACKKITIDSPLGSAMNLACLSLMEKLTTPAPWSTTLLYKPLYLLSALYYALPWMVSTRSSICRPRIVSFFQSLRSSPAPFTTSSLKIAAAGFCWGGQHTFYLAADHPSSRVSQANKPLQRLIDCAFTAHPSFVNVPADVDAVTVPMSVAVGDEDMALKGDLARQMKDILEVKKVGHEVVIMKGAKHGFAIRAVPNEGAQRQQADEAEKQAINWFTRWFV